MQVLGTQDKHFKERHASENRDYTKDTKTPKEDEMKVLSDFLRVQIGCIFDWVFEASKQRKKTHELATYHGFIFLTCANSFYEGD